MSQQEDIEKLFGTMMQLGKLMSLQAQESYEERTATMLQFSALHFLIDKEKGTVSELAQYLKLSKSSATQLVERLVKAEYVTRIEDLEDRRITRLIITQSGKQQANRLKVKIMEKMNRIFSKIPQQDIKELIRIHSQLIETLKTQHHE